MDFSFSSISLVEMGSPQIIYRKYMILKSCQSTRPIINRYDGAKRSQIREEAYFIYTVKKLKCIWFQRLCSQ